MEIFKGDLPLLYFCLFGVVSARAMSVEGPFLCVSSCRMVKAGVLAAEDKSLMLVLLFLKLSAVLLHGDWKMHESHG